MENSNRVFTECSECGVSIYKISVKGKELEVNAQTVTLKRARELYGNKVYYLVDETGRTFIDYEKIGYLPHKYSCKGKNNDNTV